MQKAKSERMLDAWYQEPLEKHDAGIWFENLKVSTLRCPWVA